MEQIKILNEGKESSYELTSLQYLIGRSSKCEIQIKDPGISGRQCELRKQGEDWYVIDLNSKNGTLLNGERISQSTKLKNGDTVQLINTRITFLKEDMNDKAVKEVIPKPVNNMKHLAVIETQSSVVSRNLLLFNIILLLLFICIMVGTLLPLADTKDSPTILQSANATIYFVVMGLLFLSILLPTIDPYFRVGRIYYGVCFAIVILNLFVAYEVWNTQKARIGNANFGNGLLLFIGSNIAIFIVSLICFFKVSKQ